MSTSAGDSSSEKESSGGVECPGSKWERCSVGRHGNVCRTSQTGLEERVVGLESLVKGVQSSKKLSLTLKKVCNISYHLSE